MQPRPGNTSIGAHAEKGGVVNVGGNAIGTVNHPRPSRQRKESRPRTDVGVLTVLWQETRAVVQVLERYPHYRSDQLASGAEVHTADVGDGDGSLRVVAVQTLAPGSLSAAEAFHHLRDAFNPRVVLLVGIAGGIGEGLAIGDVVIADSVIYYDSRRETAEGPRRRGQTQPMAPKLLHRLNAFSRRYGHTVPVEGGEVVRLFRGPVGTGDAVITDAGSDIVDFLRRFNEKTLAVETEAGGVGQAFYEEIDKEGSLHGWLTIRGISDLADRNKGHDRHLFAAERAALVMERLLPLLRLPEVPG